MAALVDVNVLVALMHARHVHSAAAVRWLAGLNDRGAIAICRVSQMGVLRILTNPSAMKDEVMSAADFWVGWDKLIIDERFTLVGEPAGLQDAWRTLAAAVPKGKSAETDCYLAAFAIAGGHSLISFDRGLRRFGGVELNVLA
ncbi:MAG: PIN domain-containing protein [Betaproteobacteria bacterium]|nr:PIN domain-containing protein [Betaproteobacteria bacterium]